MSIFSICRWFQIGKIGRINRVWHPLLAGREAGRQDLWMGSILPICRWVQVDKIDRIGTFYWPLVLGKCSHFVCCLSIITEMTSLSDIVMSRCAFTCQSHDVTSLDCCQSSQKWLRLQTGRQINKSADRGCSLRGGDRPSLSLRRIWVDFFLEVGGT